MMRECHFSPIHLKSQFKKGNNSTNQVGFHLRGDFTQWIIPFLVRKWYHIMLHGWGVHIYYKWSMVQQRKALTAGRLQKVRLMIGKYPTFLYKKPFLSHLFITGGQHVILLFHEVSDLWSLKVHLIAEFCIFIWLVFTLTTQELNQNHFFLCHSFAPICGEEQSGPYLLDIPMYFC